MIPMTTRSSTRVKPDLGRLNGISSRIHMPFCQFWPHQGHICFLESPSSPAIIRCAAGGSAIGDALNTHLTT